MTHPFTSQNQSASNTTKITSKTRHEIELELVSFNLCPYVQRAVIVLDEKAIPHKRKYIDLANKPDWFLKISPLGKVPLLKTDKGILFESSVISEYLDEITDSSIHPEDLFEKALHRSWIEFGSTILAGIAGLYSAGDRENFHAKRDLLVDKFEQLEQQLGESRYFSSNDFQLVDAVYGPIFRYFDTFDRFIDFNFFATTPKVLSYRENLRQRPSIIRAVPEDYHDLLIKFLINKNTFLSGLISRQAA